MNFQKLISFFLILSAWINTSFAQKSIELDSRFKKISLARQLLIAEDPTKNLRIEDAKNLSYSPVEQDVPNFGFHNSSFWLKGTLVNKTFGWLSPHIEVQNPNIDVVNLYIFSKKSGTHKKLLGDFVPFSKRENQNKYFDFTLQLLPQDTIEFYLNVQNSGEQFHVPLLLASHEVIQKKDSNEQIIFGLYFGFVLFVLLINSFFFFVLKDRSSLLYIGYLFCLIFLQLSLTGFGFKYFWPNSIYLANHANPIFASISILFLIKFSQIFLNTSLYLPKLHRVVNGLWVFMIIVAFAAFIDVNFIYVFSVLSINAVSMALIFIIIPASIYILKQNYKPARFFITAFIFLLISVFLFVLKNAGIAPSNPITNFGLQIGSALEVLLLTLAVVDRFNQFKIEAFERLEEVNTLKTKANIELEKKVEERTVEIQHQKVQLEHQNEEILSSIRYAKRIQNAILPPQELINELFHHNAFVYYNPKDIVSGDFYWAAPVRTSGENSIQLSLAAVVDCTGHGVPGAFMSLIGSTFLKQSLKEPTVNSPADALDFLNRKVIETLNQYAFSEEQSIIKDGMDLALIAIDYNKMKLYYSGANNSIYIIKRDKTFLEIDPDKRAIGTITDHPATYRNHEINLESGDTIYLFSDGFADQFGGEKNKKLNYKRFKQILMELTDTPIERQQHILHMEFKNWKKDYEQIDDVCVMGIRI